MTSEHLSDHVQKKLGGSLIEKICPLTTVTYRGGGGGGGSRLEGGRLTDSTRKDSPRRKREIWITIRSDEIVGSTLRETA